MPLTNESIKLNRIGFFFELGIVILVLVLLILIFMHYRRKKKKLNRIILIAFTLIWLAIIASSIAKYLYFTTQLEFSELMELPSAWIIGRITQYRVSFALILGAIYCLYEFKEIIFSPERKIIQDKIYKYLMIFFISFILITFFNREDYLLDVLCFLFTTLYAIAVLGTFIVQASKLYRRVNKAEKIYRTGLLSLILMSVFLLLIFVFLLLDRVVIIMNPGHPGFTAFYYSAWISAILAVVSAYLGYIRPAVEQSRTKK